jgi:NAD-dependent dihydropyrimidine dehydrogenase PreA subunit
MSRLADHPTVKQFYSLPAPPAKAIPLDAAWLRQLCLEAGAEDVGFVAIDRAEIAGERADILAAFPATKTLISLVFQLNREPIRSPARSAGNLEFHASYHHANEVARRIVTALQAAGVAAINPSAGFPMEMDRFPGKIWYVSHKLVAVAAGLGKMGVHRCVIHPKFGSFITLDTILVGAEVSEESVPIDFNPCLECKLCVAACPVGAIGPDGHFDFSACATHNYREFMGGFTDWARTIADSRNGLDYTRRVPDSESASMWQSLSFGANYKAAYCVAVCPAGEDVIGPFLTDRKGFLSEVVKPLQEKLEPVYVVPGSDAEAHVARRFPHKTPRRVRGNLRANSIERFLFAMPLLFQRHQSAGLDATYHFTFTGREPREATIVIRDEKLEVHEGHQGAANLRIIADGDAWLGFVRKERGLLWAIIRRKIRIRGSLRLMLAFGRCFPS